MRDKRPLLSAILAVLATVCGIFLFVLLFNVWRVFTFAISRVFAFPISVDFPSINWDAVGAMAGVAGVAVAAVALKRRR
ncbi:hypothetical protein ACFQ1L_32725 [Phytohabitans flavus]|uniref:hypothetical protein n=1 Tax=Phytohabitans flavus TaxID=1076124 RepID=UPI0015677098|nr:hypothetical protein [Phytohabitans flavus]